MRAGLPGDHPAHGTAAEWGDHLRRDRRRSAHTVRAYVATAHRLVDFLGEHRGGAVAPAGLTNVTAPELRAYLASRRGEGIGNASAARELSAVRGFLAFAAPDVAPPRMCGPRVKRGVPRPVAPDDVLALAEEALLHLGAVVRVPEPYMDAVTAVSGSGPAYFALLAEAMIEAGILLGLGRDVSTQLVVQTMLGSAKLLRDEQMHPVELRERVTSPGGTTIRAVRELEQAGVRAAFLNAIQAAMERSRELAAGAP